MKHLAIIVLALLPGFAAPNVCNTGNVTTDALIQSILEEDKVAFDELLQCAHSHPSDFINAIGGEQWFARFPFCAALTIVDPYYYTELLKNGANIHFHYPEDKLDYQTPLLCALDAYRETEMDPVNWTAR